jgi:hypothetical protein
MTKAHTEALHMLANAKNQRDGYPLNWRIGSLLVQNGWAERGSRYPLFRITEVGRQALSAAAERRFEHLGASAI